MNDSELDRVVLDLQDLAGSGISGVWQPRRDRVVLGLGDRRLLLVPRGPYARLHTIRGRPRNPAHPFSFQGACRATLHGPLTRLDKVPGDRVVDLWFRQHRLHLRLTGRRGGLWLLEGDRVIAAYDGPAPETLPPLPPPPDAPQHEAVRFAPGPDGSWDVAASRYFGRLEGEARRKERRLLLGRRLRKALARDRRLAAALEGDLDKAEKAPLARARADAVAAVMHTLSRGQSAVAAPDLEDPSTVHQVELDPRKGPGENLNRLYGRARRLDRMGERVLEHMDRVETRIRALDAAVALVDDADDETLDRLEALAPAEHRRVRQAGADEPWFTWYGPHGHSVLVGRNAAGNRRLTFQRARGDDVWLHLRGRPGAHVLLPMKRGQSPDLDTLLAAAQIVLVHAKVPEGASADVQYTRCRHVKSIKGAADGKVIVHDERVLHMTRDPSMLVGWRRDDQEELDVGALEALTTTRSDPTAQAPG